MVDLASRVLRLPTIRERCAEFAADAGREHASYRAFLAALLTGECDDRDTHRRARRVAEANFPRPKSLAEFDFGANPNVAPALIGQLATGGWVAAGQPMCLLGDSGTGKTHLLIALGTAAAEAGHRVRYVTTAALVNELVEAADERTLSSTIARYGRVDLLCCDELGYLELDRRGAELLFQVERLPAPGLRHSGRDDRRGGPEVAGGPARGGLQEFLDGEGLAAGRAAAAGADVAGEQPCRGG